jgi:hypothetical protein
MVSGPPRAVFGKSEPRHERILLSGLMLWKAPVVFGDLASERSGNAVHFRALPTIRDRDRHVSTWRPIRACRPK